MTKGIALLSGGLDSGVAAAMFMAGGQTLELCLCFDYGQRARLREQAAAQALARRWRVPCEVVALPWLGALAARSGSRLMLGTGQLPGGTAALPGDERSAALVWVPARNAVFVAVAAAYAEVVGADCVVAGFNREEAATFPDNSAAFLAAGTAFLAHGTRHRFEVQSPTIGMDKAAIVQQARALGFVAADFWSCYEGGETPCGRCESCLRSRWQR